MKSIPVRLSERSYSIRIAPSLDGLGGELARAPAFRKRMPRRALVVSNPGIFRLYGKALLGELRAAGLECETALLPDGERGKNLRAVEKLYRAGLKARLDRTSCMVALGGGVVGDIAGFAAATYMRGIAVIQVPTTLLAMVDSSIGGKTGVDLPEAKNSVGAIHQPALVWAPIDAMRTLPDREFRNGMAEVLKYGVIADRPLFEQLEKMMPDLSAGHPALLPVIRRCAAIKADVVSKDEKETRGLREILNFGHTLGHAIESVTGYRSYKHGEAIAIGMCAAGWMAESLGLWKAADLQRLHRLIEAAGLPTRLSRPLPRERVASALSKDKKVKSGELRFVLPVRIGQVVVRKVPSELALKGLKAVQG